MNDDIRAWESLAVELAGWACSRMRAGYAEAKIKNHQADWVTAADLEIEQEVRRRVAETFPHHRVVGEEYGDTGSGAVTWYVDPVDGTTNFVHGLGWSSFSLAAADERGAAAGVVADPWRGEIFSATRDGGAQIFTGVRDGGADPDGQATTCSAAESPSGGLVCTELRGGQVWPGLTAMMETLAEQHCGTRIMGSTALSLASVAAGRCVATVTDAYNTWDVLAGALIARESGAVVLGRTGEPWLEGDLPADGLVAGAPGVARTVWKAWQGA
ncbi:inositol monophosphatase [Nonomuraea phyllanthi]|uniref:Inositol monophosphatase n=1 Tax=Nonomuraea phyllanthi TaxID=2219224 RepID=A0A5C4WR65_9ACTN|nr:inositol monophosphatase family protein [Nonomuraea phyllanthi]KAB8195777.1 inositol monophosphatase [Nonomuraea phyllanthi]